MSDIVIVPAGTQLDAKVAVAALYRDTMGGAVKPVNLSEVFRYGY